MLKEIFRPTQRKILWMFLVGIPLTLVGVVLDAVFQHATGRGFFLSTILAWPFFTMYSIEVDHEEIARNLYAKNLGGLVLIWRWVPQFVYYYAIVCFVLFFKWRGKTYL